MKVGYTQNLTATAFSGTYGTLTRNAKGVVGRSYWDTMDRDTIGETDRNYSDKRYSTNPNATFDNASSANNTLAKTIQSADTPVSGPPLYFYPGKIPLTAMQLVWDFDLYVTATTKETINVASAVYVPQALAQWSFNGNGTIGAPPAFIWTGATVAGVTPPAAWSPPGTAGPRTNAPRFNDLLKAWIPLGF